MLFLTADWHLGHANILRYCNRDFRSVDEMNGALLANALATVGPTDTLYVLGDFAFRPETFDAYRHALGAVCDVRFITGNHDPKKYSGHFPLADDFRHNKRHYYLCHYPWATWRPNTVMLHGHCHGNPVPLPDDPRLQMRYDVGVDTQWGGRRYYPVSIEQIEQRIAGHQSKEHP